MKTSNSVIQLSPASECVYSYIQSPRGAFMVEYTMFIGTHTTISSKVYVSNKSEISSKLRWLYYQFMAVLSDQ